MTEALTDDVALPLGYDEAFSGPEEPRAAYAELIEAVRHAGPAALTARLEQRTAELGLSFGRSRFQLDPVPRLLGSAEWALISAAAKQRARALDEFVADAYGERRIVAAGVVPERVIESAEHYEPAMRGVNIAAGGWTTVVGLDLLRGPNGDFVVLEDNARSPSGTAFAWAARQAIAGLDLPGTPTADPAEAIAALGEALIAVAPPGVAAPRPALLTEGPGSGAFFEHHMIAERLGIPIVTVADLANDGGGLHARVGGHRREINVLYRRSDEERLTKPDGRPTALGRLLIEPLREGNLACVNAFGSGVADDKLTHAYVDEAIRFYLGEEPLLGSVPTYDLGDTLQLSEVLPRLGELVIKPRTGLGGGGVLIGPLAPPEELEAGRARIEASPERYVAQETVSLSTHPTAVRESLEPRRIDLRPYAIATGGTSKDSIRVPRAALTRFAPGRSEMIVNSSRGGGAKDTWIVE